MGVSDDVRFLALDPGGTTGWATFSDKGEAVGYGQVGGKDTFYDWLDNVSSLLPLLDTVICEDFKLFPWKSNQQAWSQLATVRIIGAIELYCQMRNITLVLQEPNIKGIGYKWAGLTPPRNHNISHEMDAYVHGVYYLQKAGLRQPQQGRG